MDKSLSQTSSVVTTSTTDTKKSPWINAWKDPVIGINAYSQSIQLSDLRGDGDFKLLVATSTKRLIAYKGASLDWETHVLDTPVAVATFYPEISKIPQPNIAVGAESAIYLYKNLKPYYKFPLPPQEWRKEEVVLWNKFTIDGLQEFVAALASLKSNGLPLSNRAHEVLGTTSPQKQLALIQEIKSEPLSTANVVTCMDSIKKNSEDEMAISQLVIGTENKELIILNPNGTDAVKTIILPGVPVFLDISGLYDSEYHIIVITREAKGFVVRNGELISSFIDLESKACGLARVDRNLFIGTMDQSVQAFSLKTFKCNFSIKMPEPITNMETMEKGRSKSIRAYLVALLNMEIRMYNEKQLVHTFKGQDVVAGMKYGIFGREDGALVILYNRSGLEVKILQRQFNINQSTQAAIQLQDAEVPLNMPKKTKLFIEQSQRERDQAPEMYRTYMKDLFRMRLRIAQNYIKNLKEGTTQISGTGSGVTVRIHATVEGIGPLFKIKVLIENLDRLPAYNLKLSYAYDGSIYKLHKSPMDLPVLVPSLPYPIELMVESIDPNGTNDTVKIFVLDKSKNVPVVTAVVNMPISEINVD